MTWRRSEVLTTVRQSADDPRVIEGLAIPYSVVSNPTDIDGRGSISREVIHPGAGAATVAFWRARFDGTEPFRRMPFRPRHGERPVGAVESLDDTPAGVWFRARIMPNPEGDRYLEEVAAGLNGISAEFGPGSVRPTVARDGIVVQREIKMYAIAGSDAPAYDGAFIALRDMDEESVPMNCEHCGVVLTDGASHTCATPAPAATPAALAPVAAIAPAPAPTIAPRDAVTAPAAVVTLAERDAAERQSVAEIVPRSTIIITREQAVYGRDATWSGTDDRGRRFSLLSDGYRAKQGDSAAAERQYRYGLMRDEYELRAERDAAVWERAGDVLSSEIPGAFPNDYIPGLLTPRIMKGRPMGGFFNRFPIADGNPKIFPKVTTSTSSAVQSAEGANPAASDFATTAQTATPLIYGAETVVSRQVLDGANPAAEAMILQDMIEGYAQASETVIKTAVEAGASASGTAITAATPFAGTLGNVIAYYATRFRSAGAQFIPSALFAVLFSELDTTGRPKMPNSAAINSSAFTADGAAGGGILGTQTFLSYASTTNVVVTGAANDYVIFESPVARFSYDQVTGPSGVRVGIWAYLVVGTRLGSLKVTAA